MSHTPKKCPFCGCTEIDSDGYPHINGGRHVQFGCGSVWINTDSIQKTRWVQDKFWCGGKVGKLYHRITQAAEALIDAQRYRLENNECGASMKGDSNGIWVDAADIDKAIEKLSGKAD